MSLLPDRHFASDRRTIYLEAIRVNARCCLTIGVGNLAVPIRRVFTAAQEYIRQRLTGRDPTLQHGDRDFLREQVEDLQAYAILATGVGAVGIATDRKRDARLRIKRVRIVLPEFRTRAVIPAGLLPLCGARGRR